MGIAKVILGIILVIIGLWLLIPVSWGGRAWWPELLTMIKGVLPIFLVFIGAILVWIESEELKIQRPRRPTRPARRPARKRRR
ncbi:MAG: hypothetical protein GTN40_04535 [Candidatus Aenigmarchaeota archaeon]|nr:hypothetical protein [Candidatus Aenigmarchaeota archaeon]